MKKLNVSYNVSVIVGATSYCTPVIDIIKRTKRWAVLKDGRKKAIRVFRFREMAYHFAKTKYSGHDIVVHKEDGTVLFIG